MYCSKCGAQLPEDALFCPKCGSRIVHNVEAAPVPQSNAVEPPVQETPAPDVPVYQSGYKPGFSTKVDSPEVRQRLARQRRVTRNTMIVTTALPFLICVGIGIFGKQKLPDMAGYGVVLSLIFFAFAYHSYRKQYHGKPYVGTVVDKYVKRKTRNDERDDVRYMIVIRDDKGKKHEEDYGETVYDYFAIGERVRCLPQFNFPLEKEDKSEGTTICMFCRRPISIDGDECPKCHAPIIK